MGGGGEGAGKAMWGLALRREEINTFRALGPGKVSAPLHWSPGAGPRPLLDHWRSTGRASGGRSRWSGQGWVALRMPSGTPRSGITTCLQADQ